MRVSSALVYRMMQAASRSRRDNDHAGDRAGARHQQMYDRPRRVPDRPYREERNGGRPGEAVNDADEHQTDDALHRETKLRSDDPVEQDDCSADQNNSDRVADTPARADPCRGRPRRSRPTVAATAPT